MTTTIKKNFCFCAFETGLLKTEQDTFPLFLYNWNIWGPVFLLQKHYLETSEGDIELAYGKSLSSIGKEMTELCVLTAH